jgi:hypothetical protein
VFQILFPTSTKFIGVLFNFYLFSPHEKPNSWFFGKTAAAAHLCRKAGQLVWLSATAVPRELGRYADSARWPGVYLKSFPFSRFNSIQV